MTRFPRLRGSLSVFRASDIRKSPDNGGMPQQNWSGNIRFRARALESPTDLDQLRRIVTDNERVRALGSRHSFNDIADTNGVLIDLTRLDAPFEIDVKSRSAWVPAAARYAEIASAVEDHGLALRNMGSLPHISIGGAIATGTHGSGDGNRILGASVTGLEIVRADGRFEVLESEDPRFAGSIVGLGALGITTRVRLDLVPSFDVRQDIFLNAPWDEVLTGFDAVMGSGYSVSLFIADWGTDVVDQVWIKSVVGTTSAEPVLPAGVTAERATRQIGPIASGPTDSVTPQLGEPGRWLDRLPHFRRDAPPSNAGDELQSEFFVAREDAPAALAVLRTLAASISPVLLVSEIRSIAADDLWLSGAYGRDTIALHFTWRNDPDGVAALLPTIETALAPFDARPHWGKLSATGGGASVDRYPRGGDFRELVPAEDPEGRFTNEYLRRALDS
ncbi:putative xylitol oxidase [Microbacterium sp. C448]|nr:putative xylitol oxidase [Microbacterium sp. C448]